MVIGQDCDAAGMPVFPPVGLADNQLDEIQQELLGFCNLMEDPVDKVVKQPTANFPGTNLLQNNLLFVTLTLIWTGFVFLSAGIARWTSDAIASDRFAETRRGGGTTLQSGRRTVAGCRRRLAAADCLGHLGQRR